jgi:hypothetical protein
MANQQIMVQTALMAVEHLSIRQRKKMPTAFSILKQGQVALLKAISICGQRFNPAI